jgi:hypothetical protein
MTEHIDFLGSQIHFYGRKLFGVESVHANHAEYMHPDTQKGRVENLLKCIQCIFCFFTLGDLPELQSFIKMVPGIPVRSLPFPRLPASTVHSLKADDDAACYDIVFTGFGTHYRNSVLDVLSRKITIFRSSKFVSRKVRNRLNRLGKIVLNIPQFQDWPWLSALRIFSALLCGKATVSLGTNDKSRISSCCRQLDISTGEWIGELSGYIGKSASEYDLAAFQYSKMAEQYEREKPFPHEIFICQALVEPMNKDNRWNFKNQQIGLSCFLLKTAAVPILIEDGYLGFNLVRFCGKFFAVRQSLGPIDFYTIDFDSLQVAADYFVGDSLDLVKEQILSTRVAK